MHGMSESTALKADVFNAQCLSRTVLDLLAEKWVLLVVHSLSEGQKRTGDLRRHVDGISEKMLIQTLRNLERHGFVARHTFSEVPPRVEYSLTELGQRLSGLVKEFDQWVEAHCMEIQAAQQRFDGGAPTH
jgi:DNA-binding HxlR family transcriptional regulator